MGGLRYSNDAGSLCVSGLRMCAQMTTGANMVEAVALKEGFCVILFFFFPIKSLHVEQNDCRRCMHFNTTDSEALVEEVSTHSVKK